MIKQQGSESVGGFLQPSLQTNVIQCSSPTNQPGHRRGDVIPAVTCAQVAGHQTQGKVGSEDHVSGILTFHALAFQPRRSLWPQVMCRLSVTDCLVFLGVWSQSEKTPEDQSSKNHWLFY